MKETVLLLHGAGRSPFAMQKIGRYLAKSGYQIVNLGYPSRQYPVQKLADVIAAEIRSCCPNPGQKIHFVTHSLGGIVLRCYLDGHAHPNLGRVVMLAPPNQGTELADLFAKNWFYKWIVGPAGEQLGTGESSFVNRLAPVDFPLGVIAGNKSLNPLFSRLIPGMDDGRIAVERTKLAGMTDFIVVPYPHSFIMFYKKVIEQIAHFIDHGRFYRI